MTNSNKTYTYRRSEKVELGKSTNETVARILSTALDDAAGVVLATVTIP